MGFKYYHFNFDFLIFPISFQPTDIFSLALSKGNTSNRLINITQMSKQMYKNKNPKELQQDIQYLLTTVRARENGLIFFLERLTDHHSPEEYKIFKSEFLEKQKIYTSQIIKTIAKYTDPVEEAFHKTVRTFWIKAKSIVKVSLERLKIMNFLNEKIFQRYEEIIKAVNKGYDEVRGLSEFSTVENLLKKRNVDALLFGRSQVNQNSDTKISKNHSDTAFKEFKHSPEHRPPTNQSILRENQSTQKAIIPPRLKSLNRYKGKKLMMEEKLASLKGAEKAEKQNKKQIVRFNKFTDKLKKNLDGVMEVNLDVAFDKKKTKRENSEAIYDQMFQRNIPQHKTISKFLFAIYGTNNILSQKLNKIKKVGMKGEKGKEVSKCKRKERPKSSQIKVKTKEEQMLVTLVMEKKRKQQKKKMVFANQVAKFIKAF